MSLDYDLSLKTTATAPALIAGVLTHFNLTQTSECTLTGNAIWLKIGPPSPPWVEMIDEAFHFKPSLRAAFRIIGTDEERGDALRAILRVTQFLLERIGGDAVLLFNGELIILQRLHEELLLNADYESWLTGHRLIEEIRLPHELRSLPSPLL